MGLNTLCLCTLVVIAIKTEERVRAKFEEALSARSDLERFYAEQVTQVVRSDYGTGIV